MQKLKDKDNQIDTKEIIDYLISVQLQIIEDNKCDGKYTSVPVDILPNLIELLKLREN